MRPLPARARTSTASASSTGAPPACCAGSGGCSGGCPGPVDVLLTHAPPRGLGDEDDRPHVGIDALHPVLERLHPRWHLHGHIHPYGQPRPDRRVGDTTIRNVIPYRMFEIHAESAVAGPDGRTAMIRDTGSPRADAEADFLRARRLQVIAALTARLLRKESGDRKALSFQEVVDALGLVDEVALGRAGHPGGRRSSARWTRCASSTRSSGRAPGCSRRRFERIDEAARRGEPLPPIDVYQIGDIYFVRDGHHRVSVHRALDLPEIEADVRLVRTVVEPDDVRAHSDLAARELRRLFLQRVPVGRAGRRGSSSATRSSTRGSPRWSRPGPPG